MINVVGDLESSLPIGDEKTGVSIIKRALEEPVRQIAFNAGLEGSVIVERLKKKKPESDSTLQAANGST